jgi:aspartyl-tRNA(Asn)/glutamyl-tRNA(Gln) amidotransferase subunit A
VSAPQGAPGAERGFAAGSDLELAFAGVAALSGRLRSREVSPLDLVEACLARIAALDGALGAFAVASAERAREGARAAAAEIASGRWRGPLHGIPFGVADAIDARGLPTALGLPSLAGRVAERDATVCARLAEQGAILVGKLRIPPPAGAGAAAEPGCRSPWDPARTAGGPSPGSAAAVAAGLVPFALAAHDAGPDTAAAECGVTALRPTYGVLSRRGAVLASFTLATLGPVTRSAEDCALVLDALAGADPREPSSVGPPPGIGRLAGALAKGLRVGVVEVPAPARGAREPLSLAQEALRSAGAIVAPASLPDVPWIPLAALLAGAEGEVVREDVLGPALGAARVPPAPASGSAADYVRAMRVRSEAQRALARLLERHDLLLAPAPDASAGPDPLSCAIALGGLPALTLPVGLGGARPVAARLVAPPLEEARLLTAGAVFQARTSHHLLRPPASPAPAVAAVTGR